MSLSLTLAVGWTVAAVIGAPWAADRAAYPVGRAALIALMLGGIPILGLLTYHNGPVAGLLGIGLGTLLLGHPSVRLRGALGRRRRSLPAPDRGEG